MHCLRCAIHLLLNVGVISFPPLLWSPLHNQDPAVAHQMNEQNESSILVNVLSQLNDDALAQTLLPILGKHAGNLALSCNQLCQLCYKATGSLNLPIAEYVERHPTITDLPERFPGCHTVRCIARCSADVADLGLVLPALARLPRLQRLRLAIEDEDASDPNRIAVLVDSVRLQLSQLQTLDLDINTSWAANSRAWQALGRATQLQTLHVTFPDADTASVTMQHLSALQPLSNLEQLYVRASATSQQQDYSFLSSMTKLTYLYMPLYGSTATGLGGLAGSISCCTRLRDLCLLGDADATKSAAGDRDPQGEGGGQLPEIGQQECMALAQLQHLTQLWLCGVFGTGSSPHFRSALQSLRQLEVLRADLMGQAVLPALASLSKLTWLGGYWQQEQGSNPGSSVRLNSVKYLGGLDAIPFEHCPQVEEVVMWGTWHPQRFSAMCNTCKHLQRIRFDSLASDSPSLSASSPVAQRLAALYSLQQLQHLTHLEFAASDDAELAAVAELLALKSLYLLVIDGGSCSAMGLTQVALLHRLGWLQLDLPRLELSQAEAQCLISSVRRSQEVLITVEKQQASVWSAALEAARAAQLPVPKQIDIQGSWGD